MKQTVIALAIVAGLGLMAAHQHAVAQAPATNGGSAQASAGAPPTLDDILRGLPTSPDGSGIPPIRFNAIRETAITYGSQAGLARRSHEIIKELEMSAQKLDVTFNFQALMVEGNVVPPVLTELSEVYDQEAPDLLRVIGKVFRIDQQARFSYNPPSWRSYVLQAYDFNSNVVAQVAPKTDEELKLWRSAVEEGFELGRQLAEENLKQNFARLHKDFAGMVLYHRMLADGMVTRPFVASSNLGVTRTADGAMHVGEVVLRITANPDFVDAPGEWKPGPSPVISQNLMRGLDPRFADKIMQDAVRSGLVREGRSQ